MINIVNTTHIPSNFSFFMTMILTAIATVIVVIASRYFLSRGFVIQLIKDITQRAIDKVNIIQAFIDGNFLNPNLDFLHFYTYLTELIGNLKRLRQILDFLIYQKTWIFIQAGEK